MTDLTDPMRWQVQNSVPLFEIRALLLYVVDHQLFSNKQSENVRIVTTDHCVIRTAEELLQRVCLSKEEIKKTATIVWNSRISHYYQVTKEGPDNPFFIGSLEPTSILWSQIRQSVGTTTASPDFLPFLISGDPICKLDEFMAMYKDTSEIVCDLDILLDKAFSGSPDYRSKGTASLRRLMASESAKARQRWKEESNG